jgi:hypothetical protein
VTREDRLLFACARQDFLPRHRKTVQDMARRAVDWELLAATAENHGLLPIVGANLHRCDPEVLGLPAPLAERLETAAFENALLKEKSAARLADALDRLREVGLEAMLLKGAALDLRVYREPWVASARDVDLLARPIPGARTFAEEGEVRRALYRQGIECDLLEHHDVNMNGVLPIPFASIWRDARPVVVRGREAWVMAPEDLLISLCINSCRKRFLRLKGLFDIAETVRRLAAEIDEERLARKVREYRCEGIVFTALAVTGQTLGCDLSPDLLGALGVGSARAALLQELIARALRTSSLADAESRPRLRLPLLLAYASYRWDQAWRSFRFALTHPVSPHPLVG